VGSAVAAGWSYCESHLVDIHLDVLVQEHTLIQRIPWAGKARRARNVLGNITEGRDQAEMAVKGN